MAARPADAGGSGHRCRIRDRGAAQRGPGRAPAAGQAVRRRGVRDVEQLVVRGAQHPGYSVLFPPLGALLTPQVVAAISAPVSAALFESLAHRRFGDGRVAGSAVVRGRDQHQPVHRTAHVRLRPRVRASGPRSRCSASARGSRPRWPRSPRWPARSTRCSPPWRAPRPGDRRVHRATPHPARAARARGRGRGCRAGAGAGRRLSRGRARAVRVLGAVADRPDRARGGAGDPAARHWRCAPAPRCTRSAASPPTRSQARWEAT